MCETTSSHLSVIYPDSGIQQDQVDILL